MNIFSKQNQSVAAAAAKVMAEQPAQVKPTTPTIPNPDTSMVDRAAGVKVTYGSLFGRKLSEEKTEDDKSDKYAPEHHSEADIKLDRKPTWPKSSKPLGKTVSDSAADGRMKEDTAVGGGNVVGMNSQAAANLPAPIQKEKVEKKKMRKESFTSAEIVSHLKENTNDNGWYVDTKKIGTPVNHKYLSPMAVKRHVTEAIIEMNQIDQINEEADILEGAIRISQIQVHPYESGFAVTLHSNNGPHSMETHPTKAAAVKSAHEWHRATGKEAKLHLPEEVEQVDESLTHTLMHGAALGAGAVGGIGALALGKHMVKSAVHSAHNTIMRNRIKKATEQRRNTMFAKAKDAAEKEGHKVDVSSMHVKGSASAIHPNHTVHFNSDKGPHKWNPRTGTITKHTGSSVKEEVEQVNEGPFSSGALKPTQAMLDKSNSIESHTTFRGKDKRGTYTAKLHRPAGSSDHKEISRVYDTDESVDLDEGGMPSSVIKSKQAREKMSPEDLHAHVKSLQAKGGPIFGGKSVEHIAREMAWSHGHGKMSPHYWNRIKHLEPKNEEVEQVEEGKAPFDIKNKLRKLHGGFGKIKQKGKNTFTHTSEGDNEDGDPAKITHTYNLNKKGKLVHIGTQSVVEEVEQVDEGTPEFNARALRYAKANAAEKNKEGRYSKKYPGGKEQHAKDTAAFMKRFPAPKNEEAEQLEAVQKAPQYPVQEADSDLPFEGPYKKSGPHKDKFGNPVKNVARHLAKKGLATALRAVAKKKGK